MTSSTAPVTTNPGGPCVYFVQATTGGPIKIGVAVRLGERLKGLQYQCPVPIVCLAWMPGYVKQEQALHDRFGYSRLYGEWFEPTAELLALIDALNCEKQDAPRPNGSEDFRRVDAEYRSLKARLSQVGNELEYAAREYRALKASSRDIRRSLKQERRELERVREARQRTQWRVYGLDPAAELSDPGMDIGDEDDAAERLVETENEVRLTLFWDDGEKKFAIRVLEGDAEFADKAWERIVEAAMVYTDSLNASLADVDVMW